VAFINHTPSPEEPTAARCSQAHGVEALPLLPGQTHTRVTAISRDGVLQVGELLAPGISPATNQGLAVLWDAQGARDVLAELKAAHVNLQGAERLTLQRVWHDSAQVRILAKATRPGKPSLPILLRLPMR
jgi:hypothetical protein